MALKRRETAELIAEELRRLDPDDTYAAALRFGVERLNSAVGRTGRRCRTGRRQGAGAGPAAGSRPRTAVGAGQDREPGADGRGRRGTRLKRLRSTREGSGGQAGEEGGGEVSTPQLVVHRDKELMAQAAAARLITKIVDAQAARGTPPWSSPAAATATACWPRWPPRPPGTRSTGRRLDLWWGDERFLPEGDPERNVTQAREALLDSVPLDPSRVHAMPASDGPYGSDADAAAAAYAEELARRRARRTTARSRRSTC